MAHYIDITQHAIVRRQQAMNNAAIVVTGFRSTPSHSATLYCDTEEEAEYLRELFFRAGYDAASWAPNHHKVTP